jgi:hypothetical protein
MPKDVLTTFERDSYLVDWIAPSRGFRRGKFLIYGTRKSYSAIIVHTTGVGVLKKAKRWKIPPIAAAARIYGTQMDASGHYVICGNTGELIQTCSEAQAAWHVGSRGSKPYSKPNWARSTWAKKVRKKNVEWWSQRFPMYQSPFELAGGKLWTPRGNKMTCNANALGIEMVPNFEDPQGPWTNNAWDKLIQLVFDVSDRRSIPIGSDFILSHSEAHPLSRTRNNLPWDPSGSQYDYARFAEKAGIPLECSGNGSQIVV